MSIAETLERSEHITHAGHAGHGGHDNFGLRVGMTMALLGVLLAFCSAMLGSERTVLVQALMEQQHAHAKYQAQDVKHRMAFLTLSQVHAIAFAPSAPPVNKDDVLTMAKTAERYLEESKLAREYMESYDAIIETHIEAQEEYEHGLLLAEIGIVIASISLLVKRKEPWLLSIAFGAVSIFIVISTMNHVSHKAHEAEHSIEVAKTNYETHRKANKTTDQEEELVKSTIEWATHK